MARDFRAIERQLAEFFRSRGVGASSMDGDLYLGVVATKIETMGEVTHGTLSAVKINEAALPAVVSLTRLAEDLAEVLD